jgi:RimJ/RimL family protein N-acetyltransferase
MILQAIRLEEDTSNPLYASEAAQQVLAIYRDYYPKTGFQEPWISYFIIREGEVVGTCGFVAPPKAGKVEIAYWTFSAFEGQGIASFACKTLLSIAHETDSQVAVTAKTAPLHNASTRILEKNHFVFSATVEDDEIGAAWLWTQQKKGN